MITKRYYQRNNIAISKICKHIDDHIEFWEAVIHLLHVIDCYDYKCQYPYIEIIERVKWYHESKENKDKYENDLKTHLEIKKELELYDIIYG